MLSGRLRRSSRRGGILRRNARCMIWWSGWGRRRSRGVAEVRRRSVMKVRIRLAESGDVPRLRELIEASVRGLQARDYSPAQLESALRSVYGVDTQLIAD